MSNLTEEQKLVKLGLRSPNQTESTLTEIKAQLQANIAEAWADFQTAFDDANLSSWDEFETWLTNNGFSSSSAANIRSTFEAKYASFSAFKDDILNTYESWADFENDFASNVGLRSTRQNDNGLSAAGLKFYEEDGVGRSGQTIPAGGAELYANQIHFSETGTVRDTDDESSGTSDPYVWSNLFVDPNTLNTGDTITVEADLTNNTAYKQSVVAELIVDGVVERSKSVVVTGGSAKTVTFQEVVGGLIDDTTGTFDFTIGPLAPESVTVTYGGI